MSSFSIFSFVARLFDADNVSQFSSIFSTSLRSLNADYAHRSSSIFSSDDAFAVSILSQSSIDSAMGFAATITSSLKLMLFAYFVLLTIIATACICCPGLINPSTTPSLTRLRPATRFKSPPRCDTLRPGCLPSSVSSSLPPPRPCQSIRQSSGTVRPLPTFGVVAFTTPPPASPQRPVVPSPVHLDQVIDSLSTLSIAKSDLDYLTNSLDSLSISSPNVVDAFAALSISTPGPPSGRPKRSTVTIPTGVLSKDLSSISISSGKSDDDLISSFGALSIKPILKSCLKSGPIKHAKKVSFGADEKRTYPLIHYFDCRRVRHPSYKASCIPHHRGFRHFLPSTDQGTPMVRYDGEYHEPQGHSDIENELFRVEDGHMRRMKKWGWCCSKPSLRPRAGRRLGLLPTFT